MARARVICMSNTRSTDASELPPRGDDARLPATLWRAERMASLDRPPGPELLTALTAVAAVDLSPRELVEVVRSWRALLAHCAAGQLDAVARLDAAAPRPEGRRASLRPAADELAPVLALSPLAASRLVGLARRVETQLPVAADALADGRMDLAQVRVTAAVLRDVPDDGVLSAVQAIAVQHAPGRSPQQLRMLLETELARRLPAWWAERAAAGREERRVRLGPSPVPGCRRITADLPLVDATAVSLAVRRVAATARQSGLTPSGEEETRTLEQLCADAFTAILTGRTTAGAAVLDTTTGGGLGTTLPTVAVPTPRELADLAEVQVVVAADTLLGQSAVPAHVPGVGAVDVDAVRTLAADARWRRLLADPVSGTLLDRGLTVYRPPSALRRHVVARDGTCFVPTCEEPAVLGQIDHTINFGQVREDGVLGVTADHNSGAGCERHHDAKTHFGWRLDQPERGRFVWTSPTGFVHGCAPSPLVPGWADRRPEWADRRPECTEAA